VRAGGPAAGATRLLTVTPATVTNSPTITATVA